MGSEERHGETAGEKTIQTAAAAPVVLSRSLSSPRIFLLPETVVCLTQQFFDCQIQRHHCYRFEESKEWWWTVESAMRLIEANRLQEGFRELNHGFDRFAAMLKDPEIGLLSCFYHMLIRLGPQLGVQLLDYATRMAMIKLGRRHPLTLVFDTLRRAGPQEVRDGGYPILRAHFQAAERALGCSDAKIARHSAFTLQALDWHHVDSSLPADSTTIDVEMWRSFERLRAAGLVEDALETLAEIAMMRVRYRRYDEAKQLADLIARWAEEYPDSDARYSKSRAWRVRYLIAREMDDMDECFLYGKKHLMSDYRTFGPEHHRPKAMMAQIQAHFREKGRPELAFKLELDIVEQGRVRPDAHGVEFKREIVEEQEEWMEKA